VEERLSPASQDYIELLFHWHRYNIAANLARGKVALDLACGDGFGTYYISQFARSITGMDIDEGVIERARKKYVRDNLKYLAGPAFEIPCRSASFDVVISFETIEHMDGKAQTKFLNEVKRVLKPGGLVVISTPDKHRTDKFAEKNPYHIKELYLEEFGSMLRECFDFVNICLQEVNLASFVWPLNFSAGVALNDYRIKCDEKGAQPTGQSTELHLYTIAFCSDNKEFSDVTESSVCYDIGRKPAEDLWQQKNLLAEKVDRLDGIIEEMDKVIRDLTKECEAKDAEINSTNDRLHELTNINLELNNTLDSIYNSNSWKMIQRYRHIMDRSPARFVLRPVRDSITRSRRGKKR